MKALENLSWDRETRAGIEIVTVRPEKSPVPAKPSETKRILVVDDEIQIVELLRSSLEAEGYSVVWATDGTIAKCIAWEWKPDLLITDIVMPGLDGISMVEEIFGSPDVRKIPVVFISGKASQDLHLTDGESPFRFSLLKKPFKLADISLLVRDLLTYSAG